MKLLLIIFFIFGCLYLVYSDVGGSLVNTENHKIYDDSMEISSSIEKKSLENDFDLSKNIKSNEEDFSLGDDKEEKNDKSSMSLELPEDDPFNVTTAFGESTKINENLKTLNQFNEISVTKNHSINIIETTPSTDKDHPNNDTTIKMINNGLDVLMRTTPANINEESLITTSSFKEGISNENPESIDKSDMALDISNEDNRQKDSNKTSSDDVQFDIGEEENNENVNNKIIIKNNHSTKNNNIIDTTTAEDITIPFTMKDKFLTTEDPFEVRNVEVNNNEEDKKSNEEINSMEVKQSTIFVGPTPTTTTPQLPIINKDEDGGEIFIIDKTKEVFSDILTSTTKIIEDQNNNTLAQVSTSLTLTSTENDEKTTYFPDSEEFTVLTSTIIIPKILSTTKELEETTTEDKKLVTKLLQEVDFSMTTESTINNDTSSSNDDTPKNLIKSFNDGAITMTSNINSESQTTQFPESKNMTFNEDVIKSKENVEGSVEKEENSEIIISNINSHQTTLLTSTSESTTISISSTSHQSTTITSDDIIEEVVKNFNKEIEKRKNLNNTTFLSNIFSPTQEEIRHAIIFLSIFLFIFLLIIISIIIIVSCLNIDNFLHMIRIKNNIIGWFLDIYDFIRCKKRKENGMFRFSNSQTSTSIYKIEEGNNGIGQTGNYNFNDNDHLNNSSFHDNRDVDLVGFGRLNTSQKVGNERRNMNTIQIN
ncbi:Hypothetical protein SRAE_2000076300 [Strongyloides ratti]|uniref:Uncharacterized protein n=1 Tax=Strongyloides ratti TaxID=34506 RepID=A0A090LD73_STRRB|nr:Hypothetical protein SRAE_2000076300 [Strongyloides ratti]CEF66093.1 Hypothetical protein SRAE_2000076300 [Strongyloides ratti]